MREEDMEIADGSAKYHIGEYTFGIRGQAEKTYRVHKIPNLDENDKVLGVLEVFEDITEGVRKTEELTARLEAIRKKDKTVRTAAGENYSFFRRNAAERKRLERFQRTRMNGMAQIFKYIGNIVDIHCGDIKEYMKGAVISAEADNNIQTAIKQIVDIRYLNRLFKFNEVPNAFTPSSLIKLVIKRHAFPVVLDEDDESKAVRLEGYSLEFEEVFTRLMEKISGFGGTFNISLTATSLEYFIIINFSGKNLRETVATDIIFLYAALFIKEILGENWDAAGSDASFTITIRFAV
jgi:hypothetical protein